MAEISDRYVEQLSTTLETMRRRVLAYYDGVFYLGKKTEIAVERLRDVAEPVAADAHDYMNQSLAENSPLQTVETDVRNTLVEMYLGISVVLLSLAGGQLAGCYALSPILSYFFDTSIVLLILISLPLFVFFNTRKNTSLDDAERRGILFTSTLAFGVFTGHLLGPRVLSIAPSTLFFPPLLFAVLFDNGVFRTPLPTLNRQTFFVSFASVSVFGATFLAAMVLGHFSTAVALLNIVHATGIYLHFQVIIQLMKDKLFMVGDSQMAYVAVAVFFQLLFTFVFGYNPDAPVAQK